MASHKDNMLEVSNLSVTVANQIILENISFELKKGATLAIVGPNGAGKTVFFRTLLNLVPYTGKIEWINKVKIGYVSQRLSASDIPISVKEFLSFKNPSGIEDSLKLVGLNSKDILNKNPRCFVWWTTTESSDSLGYNRQARCFVVR